MLKITFQDKSANFTDPFAQSLGEANFKTLQATKLYHDLLLRATHVLQNNICVLEGLAHKIEKRGITENGGHAEKYELLQTTTRDVKNKLCAVLRHMSLIQARLNRITEAVSPHSPATITIQIFLTPPRSVTAYPSAPPTTQPQTRRT